MKAVKNLFKAKMFLKPLFKTGLIKLPMVHFVIPINKPNNGIFGSNFEPFRMGNFIRANNRCRTMVNTVDSNSGSACSDNNNSNSNSNSNSNNNNNNNNNNNSNNNRFTMAPMAMIENGFGSLTRIMPNIFGQSNWLREKQQRINNK